MAKPVYFQDGRLVRLHTRLVDFPPPCESAASQYRVGLLRFESGRVLVFHGGVFGCSSRMNGKPSRPVLRGLGASDGAQLLDSCGHFVGSVPTNALVLIEFGGEFYWMVGNPEINADSARQNEGKAIVFC